MNSDFYHLLGGFYCWIFKFCQTKLSVEQNEENKTRNLLTAFVVNLIFAAAIVLFFIYF